MSQIIALGLTALIPHFGHNGLSETMICILYLSVLYFLNVLYVLYVLYFFIFYLRIGLLFAETFKKMESIKRCKICENMQ